MFKRQFTLEHPLQSEDVCKMITFITYILTIYIDAWLQLSTLHSCRITPFFIGPKPLQLATVTMLLSEVLSNTLRKDNEAGTTAAAILFHAMRTVRTQCLMVWQLAGGKVVVA